MAHRARQGPDLTNMAHSPGPLVHLKVLFWLCTSPNFFLRRRSGKSHGQDSHAVSSLLMEAHVGGDPWGVRVGFPLVHFMTLNVPPHQRGPLVVRQRLRRPLL
jgi:hypothetical protein